MSHRIAELMNKAQRGRTRAAREEAARECESLILRLWERRTAWPRGWPPPKAAKVLERLSHAEDDPDGYLFYRPRAVDEGADTWQDCFPLLVDLQRAEQDIWRDAALLELDVGEARDWLEKHGDGMDPEEQNALERLLAAAATARRRLDLRTRDPRLEDGADKEPDSPLHRLKGLEARRRELLQRIQSRSGGTKGQRPRPAAGRRKRRKATNAGDPGDG